jgi:hypothetical protein
MERFGASGVYTRRSWLQAWSLLAETSAACAGGEEERRSVTRCQQNVGTGCQRYPTGGGCYLAGVDTAALSRNPDGTGLVTTAAAGIPAPNISALRVQS